jgi:hypothetical protein
MKVIAVIERPAAVRQILHHLRLPTTAPSLRVPPDQTKGLAGDHPREWSYEPVVDDLPAPILPSRSGKADGLVCPARRRACSGPRHSA